MFYERNTKLLFSYSKRLQRDIIGKKEVPLKAGYVQEEKNFILGDLGNFFLHSRYNIEREMEKTLNELDSDAQTVILFGVGNGEIIKKIAEKCTKGKHLIIIEPIQEIFQKFLENYKLFDVFVPFKQVSFIVNGPEAELEYDLPEALNKEKGWQYSFSMVSLINYNEILREYKGNIQRIILEHLRHYSVQKNTFARWREQWVVNFWKNFKKIELHSEDLMDIFTKSSVIIVSAGPSLSKNIKLLERAKESCIVIAVGSAMTILDNNGIKPHLRMAIDPDIANFKLMQSLGDTSECPLVFSTTLNENILDFYKGPQLFMRMIGSSSLSDYVSSLYKEWKTEIHSGFSVANVALDFAVQMGAKEVVLVGQDLCYTQGKLHAEGSWDDHRQETIIKKEMVMKNIYGEEVYTDRAFFGMKKIFEVSAVRYRNTGVRFINATEGGLPIKGFENEKMESFLEAKNERIQDYEVVIAERIKKLQINNRRSNEADKKREVVQKVLNNVEQLLKVHDKLLNLAACWTRENSQDNPVITRKTLKSMRKLHGKMKENKFYTEVVEPFFEDKKRIEKVIADQTNEPLTEGEMIAALLREVAPVGRFLELNRPFLLELSGFRNDEFNSEKRS